MEKRKIHVIGSGGIVGDADIICGPPLAEGEEEAEQNKQDEQDEQEGEEQK